MTTQINKNTVTSLLLISIIVIIAYRITPVHVDHNLDVIISKNTTDITNINQPRNIEKSFVVGLDTLNLFNNGKFSHPVLGNIAKTSENFFLDVNQYFSISREGLYRFTIGSDDGFLLVVDGENLCSHPSDKPFSNQDCDIYLTPGKHFLAISYFQGFGNSGFNFQYQTPNGKIYWFGENSAELQLE